MAALYENGQVTIAVKEPALDPDLPEEERRAERRRHADYLELVDALINEFHGLGTEPHDDTIMASWLAEVAIRKYRRVLEATTTARPTPNRPSRPRPGSAPARVLEEAVEAARQAVLERGRVRCSGAEYRGGVRSALNDLAATAIDEGDEARARHAMEEVRRLDLLHRVREGAPGRPDPDRPDPASRPDAARPDTRVRGEHMV
jgi:hypothetical protein